MPTPDESERIVREYFEARSGWSVTRLDTGKVRAADYRICSPTECFLCEVKTIQSVRANFPYTPLQSHLERRRQRQERIENWKEESPDTQLILRPGEWEYIFGDEAEFRKRYRHVRRNTTTRFRQFSEKIHEHFADSKIGDWPYNVRVDSDDLYSPNQAEMDAFFQWLEQAIKDINARKIGRGWNVDRIPYSTAVLYTFFYPIHKPNHEYDQKAEYQITIEGPLQSGPLKLNIFSYGGLNLEAITSNVESGLRQLESSALRESDTEIPRVIVLAFESDIGFEWGELWSHITWLLHTHHDLSAIAVLQSIPTGNPPAEEEGFLAWAKFQATASRGWSFFVFHNPWIKHVRPLPVEMFDDPYSIQISPLEH